MMWRRRALCTGCPTSWFYENAGSGARYTRARNLCNQCPVQAECLDDALEWERRHRLDDITGYRGGMSANQRRHVIESERQGVA